MRDSGGAVVASPSFAMGAVAVSTSTQTSTGTFGSNSQRITVDNPNGSTNGGAWTLALNADVSKALLCRRMTAINVINSPCSSHMV